MVELIRLMVLRGELAPGERIIEVQLAERLRVGRSTVREALRRLEGEGLLVADESGGMHVIAMDGRRLESTLRARAALEELSAGLAAGRVRGGGATPAQLRELEALAAPDGVLGDRHFHRAIATLGGNGPSRDALNHLWDRVVLAAAHDVPGAAPGPAAAAEHRALVEAIAAADEDEAAALARRHVLAALG